MKADMATVNRQAGLFAGDEGYEVDIANHTDLTGGLVTSSQKAESEGKNRFSTGTLSHRDIENHAEHKGSAISVSGSAAANFDTPLGKYGQAQSSKTVTDEKGNTQLATGKDSLQMGASVGIGLDKDSQRSQTKSGINTANLTIRDEKAQLAKTGKTVEETRAAIKTDITLETAEAHSGKLESRFDKNQLQKELDYQVKATSEFQSITKPAIDEAMASHATSKRKEADDLEKQGKYQQAEQMRAEAKDWETGGKYRQAVDSITNAVGLALGGKPTEGVIAGAASPYINEQIKNATKDIPELNIPAHMIWGAIEAELQGGKATSGAVAAGVGEAGAHYLTQALYGTDNPESLTEAQKKTIADLSKVAGGVAAGLASSTSGGNSLSIASNVSDGMGIAESAVENNFFNAIINNPQVDWFAKAEGEEVDDIVTNQLKQEHPVAYAVMENGVAIATETGRVILVAREVVLEVAPFLLTGGSAVSINPTLWGQLTKFAVTHPKLTETVVSGTVSTAYDIKNGEVSLEKTGMNYVMGRINAGKTVAQQLAIGLASTAIEETNDKENTNKDIAVKLVAEPVGISTAVGVNKMLNQLGSGSLSRQALSTIFSQEVKDRFEKSQEDTEKEK